MAAKEDDQPKTFLETSSKQALLQEQEKMASIKVTDIKNETLGDKKLIDANDSKVTCHLDAANVKEKGDIIAKNDILVIFYGNIPFFAGNLH